MTKKAIPIEWKTLLKAQENIPINEKNIRSSSHLCVKINNTWKQIEKVTSKNIYIKIILKNIQPPTVIIDTWIKIYIYFLN